ncbi:plasmid maintenance protein CcdB [Geotalea uraniireducens]|uniref:Toxin CcdB n=1 Tax=Geotalea uraniireducens TaxID=351604 RepID=A0ABM8EP92_9BACT|nr:CcdB family protein [Geotalea uraniireducens]BDV43871.1 plasmid maintenance protein CcdB [Geotalea uraniireducens]
MAQFDVYENQNQETKTTIPYLLDVQADLLDNLSTRVVVPLITAAAMGKAAKHLNPQFTIRRITVIMSTAELAGINLHVLGDKVCSLKEHRAEILAALDFLCAGF